MDELMIWFGFNELDKNTVGLAGMKENDLLASRTRGWFTKRSQASSSNPFDLLLDAIGRKRDVMHPLAIFRKEFSNRAVIAKRFEQLDFCLTYKYKCRTHLFRWHLVDGDRRAVASEEVNEGVDGAVEMLHRYGDMVDSVDHGDG
jgi:hypothetical protein